MIKTRPTSPKLKMETRHGVHIRQHKHWNTKTIYNDGHVMRIYRRQPKQIRFRSPMLNDFNQHLCDGWFMSDIADHHEATMQQLMNGLKPFAIVYPKTIECAQIDQKRLESMGLVTALHKRKRRDCNSDYKSELLACHDISVRDIGNLHALIDDYAEIFQKCLEHEEIAAYSDTPLKEFFADWDSPPLPLWLTGLILGYPVENTISLYLEGHGRH